MRRPKVVRAPTRHGRAGSTLLVTMIMTALGAAVAGAIMLNTMMRIRLVDREICLEQAFYIANAGAERAAAEIGTGNDLMTTTLTGSFGAGSYEARIESEKQPNNEIVFDITSIGRVKNVERVIALHGVRRVSWARYALWYDTESTKLWIAPGERFGGRVYSKPQLHFHDQGLPSTPQVYFADRVWSVPKTIEKASNRVDPIFEKGVVLNAEVEDMAPINFTDLLSDARVNGIVLEGESSLHFHNNTMYVTNSLAGWKNYSVPIPDDGLLVYVQTVQKRSGSTTKTYYGDANVAGPNGLNGKVTVVADRNINIVNHLKYKYNPETYPDSTDALGLIAQQNVVVETKAPKDLYVFAHIIAKNGGFGVRNYDSGASRGYLNVYGGIANKQRQAVGIVGGSGYNKNYVFDGRFAENPPPSYPKVRDELEWDYWEG